MNKFYTNFPNAYYELLSNAGPTTYLCLPQYTRHFYIVAVVQSLICMF